MEHSARVHSLILRRNDQEGRSNQSVAVDWGHTFGQWIDGVDGWCCEMPASVPVITRKQPPNQHKEPRGIMHLPETQYGVLQPSSLS